MRKEQIDLVVKWAEERNLHTADAFKQMHKVWEEYGELRKAIGKNDLDGIKDGIGDVAVTLIVLLRQKNEVNDFLEIEINEYYTTDILSEALELLSDKIASVEWHLDEKIESKVYRTFKILRTLAPYFNTTLEECLDIAYNEIKDRKGKMENGLFVKESK